MEYIRSFVVSRGWGDRLFPLHSLIFRCWNRYRRWPLKRPVQKALRWLSLHFVESRWLQSKRQLSRHGGSKGCPWGECLFFLLHGGSVAGQCRWFWMVSEGVVVSNGNCGQSCDSVRCCRCVLLVSGRFLIWYYLLYFSPRHFLRDFKLWFTCDFLYPITYISRGRKTSSFQQWRRCTQGSWRCSSLLLSAFFKVAVLTLIKQSSSCALSTNIDSDADEIVNIEVLIYRSVKLSRQEGQRQGVMQDFAGFWLRQNLKI